MDFRPVGSSLLSWTLFIEMFLEKYIPRNIRDQLIDQFPRLEQGSTIVMEYGIDYCFVKDVEAFYMHAFLEWISSVRPCSLRVNRVYLFWQLLRLMMKVILALVIT